MAKSSVDDNGVACLGISCRCQVRSRARESEMEKRMEGRKNATPETAVAASLRGNPSCHKKSMYSENLESREWEEVGEIWYMFDNHVAKRRNAAR